MKGRGPICLRLANHNFYEHETFASARAEANRLADKLQSAVVVYVPVMLVEPPRKTYETTLTVDAEVRELVNYGETSDLLF